MGLSGSKRLAAMTETRSLGADYVHPPLFSGLSAPLRARIQALSFRRTYRSRETIYTPDDAADGVYWIEEGRVKVYRVSDDGRELTFRYLRPGDIFGEECMAPRERRQVYAQSLDTTVLVCMASADFRKLLAREIEFTLLVALHNCRRAQEVESLFSETVFRTVRRRVAAGLLRLYRQGDPEEKTIRVTHQEVANLVGSTRETTTSVLQAFREAGVLEMANRRVTVLDPDGLRQLAEHP